MRICIVILLTAMAFLSACVSSSDTANVRTAGNAISPQFDSVCSLAASYPEKVEIKYAKGLRVDYRADGIHVFISNPDEKTKGKPTELTLTAEGKKKSARIICTTALQMGNFEVLGMEDCIVGINSLKNIFSKRVLEQIANGKTVRVGKEGVFDVETVIAAKPDYIFVSASKYGGFEALKECGIPLIPHHGYKETDPLGQAEWIKLIGLMTGQTRRANAVFDYIEKEYTALKEKVAGYVEQNGGEGRPTVLSGRQIRDGWYTMGGKSYLAQIFRDAGAHYIMEDLENTGGVTLDFETVYAKGIKADYWQIDGTFNDSFTLDDLTIEDARYADIAAFKNGKVLFCNFSMTPYRELAGVAPHLLLADFVKAFHPTLLPTHKPMFYDFIK